MNSGEPSPIAALVVLVVLVIFFTSLWKIFSKAGRPGWLSLVPIVNVYYLILIANRPGWWILFFLIPIVNVVVAILVTIGVANKFGKGSLFGVGMVFLPFIFYPLLAFTNTNYEE